MAYFLTYSNLGQSTCGAFVTTWLCIVIEYQSCHCVSGVLKKQPSAKLFIRKAVIFYM